MIIKQVFEYENDGIYLQTQPKYCRRIHLSPSEMDTFNKRICDLWLHTNYFSVVKEYAKIIITVLA